MAREQMAQNTPVPVETGEEDDLVCEGLHCMDVEPESIQLDHDQAWHCTFYVHENDIEAWKNEEHPETSGFLATAAKRQRA